MNKNRHRIVFNAARGQHMAVSETASTFGSPSSPPMSVLTLAALLLYVPAHAQIVADPSAPGNQRPTILQTANGLPQVNIQTPSAAGVSRNTYRQFDVQPSGVILNNSRTNTNTQLAGNVAGNPWINTPARVILNEVNSSNPSHLKGPVEVAGQRAEVIIANPSGIQVNGGSFLNASGVTLTTGTPVMNSGNLESYRVGGGTVVVEGLGLDTRTADHTRILARAAEVNAGLWANHLQVVTGANEISADGNTVTPTPTIAQGQAPRFMLDVAAIGGMYAGHIFLVGTEAGLGVNNRGTLAAQEGEWVLKADGSLINTGKVQAKGDISIQASAVENTASGEISSGARTSVTATGDLNNRGLIDGQTTRLQARNVNNIGTGRLYGDTLAIQADTVRNDTETINGVRSDAVIAARQRLDIGAQTLINREGATVLSLGDMALGGTLDANGQASGMAQTIQNQSATIEALGSLTVAAQTLENTNTQFVSDLVAGPTSQVLQVVHNGVSYDPQDLGMNFGPLNTYVDNASFRLVLPSTEYPFSIFPIADMSWARKDANIFAGLGTGSTRIGVFGPAVASLFAVNYSRSRVKDCRDCNWEDVDNYTAGHPIWAKFGVTPFDPASSDAALKSAAQDQLDQKIAAYNTSVAARTLRDWTVIDATAQEFTSENGGILLQGGGAALLQGVKVDADQDINIQGGIVSMAAATDYNASASEHSTRGTNIGMSGWHDTGKGIDAKHTDKGERQTSGLDRTELNGANVSITATGSNGNGGLLAIAGTTVNTPGTLTLSADQLTLGTQNTQTDISHTSHGGDWAWQEAKGQGSSEQTTNYNQFNAAQFNVGTLATPIKSVEVGLGGRDSISALAQQPGMGWIAQINNDPTLAGKVDWTKVEEAHTNWHYSQQGLTPEAAAVVTLVVAYFTAGAASGAGATAGNAAAVTAGGGATGATISGVVGGAVTAGISALAGQAAVALINNKGDIGGALDDLGSSASVKNLLTAIVTGGVLGGLNLNPTGLPTSGAGAQGYMAQLGQNLQAAAARAVIGTAINGGSLEDSLKVQLKAAFIDTFAAQVAHEIGDWTQTGALDGFANKIAHAVAGCAIGAAKATSSSGCGAGALGAAIGELSAELYGTQIDTVQFASMMAGIAAAIAGGDTTSINLASQTGANAAANNYLKHAERKQLKAAQKACYETGDSTACGTASALQYKDEMSDKLLANATASCEGAECSEVSNYIQQQMRVLGCTAPSACPDYDTLSDYWRVAQAKAQGLEGVYPESWLLDAKAVLDIGRFGIKLASGAVSATRGSLDGLGQLAKVDAKQIAALDNKLYTDWPVTQDLIGHRITQLADRATHNPDAPLVVLGKYVAGSTNSYEQVARAKGATYFELPGNSWDNAVQQLGAEKMWSINREFLDSQIAKGKVFEFTADPRLAKTLLLRRNFHIFKRMAINYPLTPKEHFMQLKNDFEGRATLKKAIFSYFQESGRRVNNFLDTEDEDFFYAHYLLASRYVFRYAIGMDRRVWLGGVDVAIGPHYFPLRSLLDAKTSDRLMIEASTAAIKNNLMLLDEFLATT